VYIAGVDGEVSHGVRYYFEELRYQKVSVAIHSYNEESVVLHEKLGLSEKGRCGGWSTREVSILMLIDME
jgi:RimJ/RimL family protein N-acetyltransferase